MKRHKTLDMAINLLAIICNYQLRVDYLNIKRNILTISLSRHEQVCLMKLDFERYFSHHGATLMIMSCIYSTCADLGGNNKICGPE